MYNPPWTKVIENLNDHQAIDKLVASYSAERLAEFLVDVIRGYGPPAAYVFVRAHLHNGSIVWVSPVTLEHLGLKLNSVPGKSHISEDQHGTYWHWDEVEGEACGPFVSVEDAEQALMNYSKSLDTKHSNV